MRVSPSWKSLFVEGSIFMGLLSTLAHFYHTEKEISGSKFGFLAYGSGSKSKVFEGTIQPDWKLAIAEVKLFETIEKSLEIERKSLFKKFRMKVRKIIKVF